MKLRLIFTLLLFPILGLCQFNPWFSQLLKYPEFINPGYNRSMDRAAFTMLRGENFGDVYNNEQITAFHLNVPITKWHTGLGENVIVEELEDNINLNLDINSYVDLKISNSSFLSFGLSGGIHSTHYKTYDGYHSENLSDSTNFENSNNFHSGFGINLFTTQLHLGTSLHYQPANKNISTGNGLYTLYLNGSYLISLDQFFALKPTFLVSTIKKNSEFNYGIYALYKDKASIGIVHRVNKMVSIQGELKIFKFLRIGYGYDIDLRGNDIFYGHHEFYTQVLLPKITNRNGKTYYD
jgi:type IX secretion system PorP/SprF family membrane protein